MNQPQDRKSPGQFQHVTQLPRRHADLAVNFIDQTSRVGLVIRFACFYAVIVLASSLIFWLISLTGATVLTHSSPGRLTFPEIAYFNFETSLTVTYGDYVPVGIGRILAILDAFMCLSWFSVFAGVVVIKLLLLPQNAVTFSRYAYYLKDDERFMVVFLNTLSAQLVNAQFSSFLRIGDHWSVHPGTITPYVGNIVWHYEIDGLSAADIKALRIGGARDTLRFGISANYRFATYASAIGYSLEEIFVLDSRTPLMERESLQAVHLPLSEADEQDFHFKPQGAITFVEYARSLGAILDGAAQA
jgi:hypothetical protein